MKIRGPQGTKKASFRAKAWRDNGYVPISEAAVLLNTTAYYLKQWAHKGLIRVEGTVAHYVHRDEIERYKREVGVAKHQPERMLRAADLRHALGYKDVNCIQKMAANGSIKATKFGGRWVVTEDEVRRFVCAHDAFRANAQQIFKQLAIV